MFRSFASSLISFFAILLFAFTFLFLWSGSEGIKFKRVAMEGDRSTQSILEELRKKSMAQYDASKQTDRVEMEAPAEKSTGDGPAVVVWISIPGFRGDYLEKAETPFFDKVVEAGAGSNKLRPNFPCLTFPAHATMATGVTPDKHGIVADLIRVAEGEVVTEPTDPALLEAEPIWTTASRQGIVTLVHDWPLSQNQTGDNVAASFLDSYDAEATDEARLNKVLEEWRKLAGAGAAAEPAADAAEESEPAADGDEPAEASDAAPAAAGGGATKPRLIMLKLNDILKAGLTNGPRTDETYAAITATDTVLQTFLDTVEKEWSTLADPSANLVVLITTDHGMAERDKNVNIAHLLGDEMMANADIVAHDAIANLYFKGLPESEGEKKIFLDKFDAELGKRIYFRTLSREDIPEAWNYVGDRTGDRVLVLKTGYAFVDQKSDEPVFDPASGDGFFGGYGYPVEDSSRMSGQYMMGGFPNAPLTELDETTHLSFHATVCKMLGIDPAEGAATEALPVK